MNLILVANENAESKIKLETGCRLEDLPGDKCNEMHTKREEMEM